MKRLIDEQGSGNLLRRACDLIGAADSSPPCERRKQRIRANLLRRAAAPSQRPWRMPMLLVPTLLALGAVASAGVRQGGGLRPLWERAVAWPRPSWAAHASTNARESSSHIASSSNTALSPDGVPTTQAVEPQPHVTQAEGAQLAGAPADASLVALGMQRLRTEHKPRQALELLEEYQRRQPNGALAEETMALAIEAANASRDARARHFAERYIARFPSGRFLDLAQKTLAREGRPQ